MWSFDLLGYLAGLFLILMALMKTQAYMRMFNIAGNSTFILYGWLAEIWPVLFLNTVMLAIHAYRLFSAQPKLRSRREKEITRPFNPLTSKV